MEPKIVTLSTLELVGQRMSMSFAQDRTAELWRNFMPRRSDLGGSRLYSVTLYPNGFFKRFDPGTAFEKWAAGEADGSDVPEGMERLKIPAGTYAVFHYVGSSDDAPQLFGYIFRDWLPKSRFAIDDRPHFEILGDKYKTGDPQSEEDIYIPVRPI